MPEDSTAEAPPAFVVRMHAAIAAAVARHSDELEVHHEYRLRPGVDGWQSTLHVVGHLEVEAAFWYDSNDQDVMFWGDAPLREWHLVSDSTDDVLDERGVHACSQDLPDAGRATAGGRSGRVQRR